ncbi:MAG: gamma-glutamyltransferase [Candidatus Palauibacterales bacterium]|nr:gamma-glutamyltransferase [Candidatus Palauibacterales bacterium]
MLRRSAAPVLLVVLLVACGGSPGGGAGAADSVTMEAEFPAQNRPDVAGTAGAVSSDHPLASAAGYRVLRDGGNAVDAAVTMAAVLAVVRPHMNGVGGDSFGLFYDGESGQVSALNGSGRAGELATPEFFADAGREEIPTRGALSVSVPGSVGAWATALEERGSISLAEALEPAIRYAEEGFPVSTELRADLADHADDLNEAGRAIYLRDGEAPAVGTLLRNPALAESLRTIAEQGPGAMYGGEIGDRLASFLEERGGYLRPGDFADHTSTWTDPIGVDYRGHRVLTFPPNTQGFVLLQQMKMAEQFDLESMGHNSTRYLHTLVELKKLAFGDRARWLADPSVADIPMDSLLSEGYLHRRARLVSPDSAMEDPGPGIGGPAGGETAASPEDAGDSGDTVYLTAVDADGNAVSWIQSLYYSFGSGLVEPETGIVLQNRGGLFTLEEGHPNRIAPGKRPFHTLMPAMALRDGQLAFTFGTPGGDSQSQTLLQVFHNIHLFGMTPQQAVEAPRYRSYGDRRLAIEARVRPAVRDSLDRLGHRLDPMNGWLATFGGVQMIYVHPESGALVAAAGPRREAYAIAY